MSETNENVTPNFDPNTVKELERARSDLKALRAEKKALEADADRLRGERDTIRTQFEAYQTDAGTKLTEAQTALERAKAESESALAEVRTAGDRALMMAQAETIATRLGAHNAADAVRLADLSEVKRDESGAFVGLSEALEAAKASKGYLYGEPPKTGAEQGTTQAPKPPRKGAETPVDVRGMDPKDYEANRQQFLKAHR